MSVIINLFVFQICSWWGNWIAYVLLMFLIYNSERDETEKL